MLHCPKQHPCRDSPEIVEPMTDPLAVKRISPLRMMSPFIAFLLIAAGWTAWWFYARGQAQDRLAEFEARTLALNCASRDWGGFPFRIHVDCQSPSVEHSGVRANADKLRLIIQAWNANHVIGAIFGPVNINGITVTGEAIRFSHRNSKGELAMASLLAESQTLTLPSGKQMGIANLQAHMKPDGSSSDAFLVTATASQLSLEELRLDRFTIDGSIKTDGSFELMSEPTEYLDAIWFAQRIAGLGDTEMNAAQQIIHPLLQANNNKLPILMKDGAWYWGPFEIARN
jgi:hypothetical protein